MSAEPATIRELFPEVPTIKGERVVIRRLREADAEELRQLADSAAVNRYLPTFLLEQQTNDMQGLIRHLYDDLMEESLFLGVFIGEEFYGLMELYGYKGALRKISVGCRLSESSWGKGISTEATGLIVDYLYSHTPIEIITASSMIENHASANVLRKCGFTLVSHGVEEDWGYDAPVLVDKWIR